MTIPERIWTETDALKDFADDNWWWVARKAIARALLAAEQRGRDEERERAAKVADEFASRARTMSKDEFQFNKFERRDFDSMSIAYAQAAAAIRAGREG